MIRSRNHTFDRRLIGGNLILLALSLSFASCVREEIAADLDPPPTPEFIVRSSDTTLVEQGIDAVPEGDFIALSWLAAEAQDLAGYRIYRQAEDSMDFLPPELVADLTLADLGLQSLPNFLDNSPVLTPNSQTGLSQGFFYWVSAYDASGNESGLSVDAYYKLMPKPVLTPPLVQSDSLVLSWSYSQAAVSQVDYFVVRLYDASTGVWTPFWMQQHALFDPLQVIAPLPAGSGLYLFQVDVVGASVPGRPVGSEAALQFEVL